MPSNIQPSNTLTFEEINSPTHLTNRGTLANTLKSSLSPSGSTPEYSSQDSHPNSIISKTSNSDEDPPSFSPTIVIENEHSLNGEEINNNTNNHVSPYTTNTSNKREFSLVVVQQGIHTVNYTNTAIASRLPGTLEQGFPKGVNYPLKG